MLANGLTLTVKVHALREVRSAAVMLHRLRPNFGSPSGVDIMPEGYMVPEPLDTATPVRVNSASGMPPVLDRAFKENYEYHVDPGTARQSR